MRFSVAPIHARARVALGARSLSLPRLLSCVSEEWTRGYGLSPPLVLTICTHDLYSNIENRTPHTPRSFTHKEIPLENPEVETGESPEEKEP